MMAARFLRRSLPVLRQARCYADAPSGSAQMSFTFASPTQVYFKEASVKQVDVPTLTGAFGILPAHVPTLQVLRPGVVTVFNDDGSATKFFVSSGSITVNADSSVQLLAEEAFPLDQLDVARSEVGTEPIGGFGREEKNSSSTLLHHGLQETVEGAPPYTHRRDSSGEGGKLSSSAYTSQTN
uniref:ATP synthase F(1) complex subunit delta, mitochondrial n=1 Tax=Hucho hucho TaxID=62062 RepID=A0A4W5KCE5_9TELE